MASLVAVQERPKLDVNFWRGRRVLLTGHTGFKGAWLSKLLVRLGAEVCGVSLAPNTTPNLFELLELSSIIDSRFVDIRNGVELQRVFREQDPEIVFHLAAQALVRPAYQDPALTYSSNVMGTVNVLESIRASSSVKLAIMVTTDKVYRNLERDEAYCEEDQLGGYDPYSASKAACELLIDSYRKSFCDAEKISLISVRAGNVIGGGDWAEDRLFPDLMKAWANSESVLIRRPNARRPWQHVLEPLSAYLLLAQHGFGNMKFSQAFNIGPDGSADVRSVAQQAHELFGKGQLEFASETTGPHEAGLLALDASKLRDALGIVPVWNLNSTVARSVDWYRQFYRGELASRLCDRDIDEYFGWH